MMYLKIMSGEDLPDGNPSKGFQMLECESVIFRRRKGSIDEPPGTTHAVADITVTDRTDESAIVTTQSIDLTGNAYLLNEAGKTIGSFAYASCG